MWPINLTLQTRYVRRDISMTEGVFFARLVMTILGTAPFCLELFVSHSTRRKEGESTFLTCHCSSSSGPLLMSQRNSLSLSFRGVSLKQESSLLAMGHDNEYGLFGSQIRSKMHTNQTKISIVYLIIKVTLRSTTMLLTFFHTKHVLSLI